MSNLETWARGELERLEDGDEMQHLVTEGAMQIVHVFSEQGHSGFSASYMLGILTRLLDWKPLTPLTGEDDEWSEAGALFEQNKRYSAVFRENKDNATAYDIGGKVFSDDGGKTWWSNRNSHVPVTFPYMPPDHPERILVEADASEDAIAQGVQ